MYYFLRASLYDIYWGHMSCNSNNNDNIDSIDTFANAMVSRLCECSNLRMSGYSSSSHDTGVVSSVIQVW